MNQNKEALDRLDRLAALARAEAAPAVPFGPALALALRRQRREARVQAWLLSAASVAAAVVLLACLPALVAGADPLEAVFQVAYSAAP